MTIDTCKPATLKKLLSALSCTMHYAGTMFEESHVTERRDSLGTRPRSWERRDFKMASGEGEGKPRDASVIENLLHEQGITEYEPQVVQLLLEFSYREFGCHGDD